MILNYVLLIDLIAIAIVVQTQLVTAEQTESIPVKVNDRKFKA